MMLSLAHWWCCNDGLLARARLSVIFGNTLLRYAHCVGKEQFSSDDHALDLSRNAYAGPREPLTRWHLGAAIYEFGRVQRLGYRLLFFVGQFCHARVRRYRHVRSLANIGAYSSDEWCPDDRGFHGLHYCGCSRRFSALMAEVQFGTKNYRAGPEKRPNRVRLT